MSTKAIRELIARAKKEWPDAGLLADLASIEVGAIRRAALSFQTCEVTGPSDEGFHQMHGTLDDIAAETL